MERSRVTGYIRIAVTALSLPACVLLVALWVRSYWWQDVNRWRLTDRRFLICASGRNWASLSYTSFTAAFQTLADSYGEGNSTSYVEDWDPQSTPVPGWSWRFSDNKIMTWFEVVVPYWFLIVVAGALTAASQIRWSRRFSLRTLLIAITLVAIGLGAVIYLAR